MTRIYWITAFLLVAIATAATAWLNVSLPEQIPTHWNIRGEVDGHGGKWTLFLFPLIMVGILALFYFLPALSPKHFEVDTFRSTYLYIMVLVIGLFAYMDGVVLYVVHQTVAKRATVDMGRSFLAGLFLFFALLGNVIGKVRKNFWISAIRVPWTLVRKPILIPRVERYASSGGLGLGRGSGNDRFRDDRAGCSLYGCVRPVPRVWRRSSP